MRIFGRRFLLSIATTLAAVTIASAQTFDGLNSEYANPFLMKRADQLEDEATKPKISTVAPDAKGLFEAVDPATYRVGPGDYLQIVLGPKSSFVSVNPEGYVIVESAPPVRVAGMTLLAAKNEIQKAVATQFKSERIHVTLAQAKVFQVSLSGEVVNPGLYSFESGVRLSSALERAGGFSYVASRHVIITGADGKTRECDLGAYFRDGDLAQNPYLNQGDRVLATSVDFSGNVMYVRGEKGLRAIQASSGENLEMILRRYQGSKGVLEWFSVRIYDGDKYRETVLRKDAASYVPAAGSVLEPFTQKKVVFVGGTVVQPGFIDYDPSYGAYDYIAKAGITINTKRDLRDAQILDASGRLREVKSAKDPVYPGDHIWVPRSGEAKTRDYVGLISSISSLAVAVATLYLLIGN
jgi:protein involved in polysaccharide export with SLBB domain